MFKVIKNEIGVLKVLFFMLLVGFSNYGCNLDEKMTQITQEEINKSPELKALDNMCKQIPLPDDFQLIRKSGLDDQRITFTNLYYSKTEYYKARKMWEEYFSKNSWKLIKEDDSFPETIEFRNDAYRVVIQYEGIGRKANYGITCEKLSLYSE